MPSPQILIRWTFSARFLKPVIAKWVHEVTNEISSRRDIFQTAWAHILPNNPEGAASVLLADGEAHAARSLFRSSKAGVVPEIAPVADEPEQPPVPEGEPELGGLFMDEEEPAPQDPLTPAPLEQPPVVIGAEPVPESELPAPVLEHRSLSGTIVELSSPHVVAQVQRISIVCMPP